MAVAVQLGHFPDSQVVGCLWQGMQPFLLGLLKATQRLLLGRSVNAQSSGRFTPGLHILIGLKEGSVRTATQEIALHIVDAALFDLAFVFWRVGSARRNEKAIVFGAFPIRLLNLWVIPAGSDDGRLEIVDDDPAAGHHRRRRTHCDGSAARSPPSGQRRTQRTGGDSRRVS